MKRRSLGVAGLVFLAACRQGPGNDRGGSERRSAGDAPAHSASMSIPEREAATARTLAAMRAAIRDELEMTSAVAPRAQTDEVRDLAARIVQQRTDDLDALAGLGRDHAIDPRGADADPLILADRAVSRDALDRLGQASGPELDALYVMLEAPRAIRLARLADQAEGLARDPETASILRRIAARARDTQARALALTPRACGGRREVKAAAAPHLIPALEDPAARAAAGGPAGPGSTRARGIVTPGRTDL
jgi:hypothetical protein